MSKLGSRKRKEYLASFTPEEKALFLSKTIHSEKSHRNMAKAKVGFYDRMSDEARKLRDKAISEGNKKRWASYSPEERAVRLSHGILSECAQINSHVSFREFIKSLTPEQKREWVLRTIQSEKVLAQKGECMQKIWDNYTDEERAKRIRNIMQSNAMRPSEPELLLQKYLDAHFPNEWVYNGDCSKGIVFGTKIPDFFNVNSKKVVLEVFGVHWHQEDEVEPLKAHYRKFGFKCIIIWEQDCYSPESLDKILREV